MKLFFENWRKFLNEEKEISDNEIEKLKKIQGELEGASKMHQSQADRIGAIIDDLLKEQDISEEEITEILSGLNGSENLEESQNTNPEDLQEAVFIFLEMKEEALEEKKRKKKKKKKKKKKDACYRKVKARYDVWPSAYASGALVKCRKVGAKNWGNKSKKKNENMISLDEEGLKAWFDDADGDGQKGWEQIGGKYDGKPCAKQPGQTTKPKCASPEDAASMTKDEKESAARRKRKKDPNPDRKGKAKNVNTKPKKESLDMKITKEKLQQIIQEEINNLKEKLSAKDKKEKAKLKKQKKDIEKKLDTIHHK